MKFGGLPEVPRLEEILFEFSAVGNSVKVCAVDPRSLVEATIVGPVSAGEEALKRAAKQKLIYVLTKRQEQAAPAQNKRLFA